MLHLLYVSPANALPDTSLSMLFTSSFHSLPLYVTEHLVVKSQWKEPAEDCFSSNSNPWIHACTSGNGSLLTMRWCVLVQEMKHSEAAHTCVFVMFFPSSETMKAFAINPSAFSRLTIFASSSEMQEAFFFPSCEEKTCNSLKRVKMNTFDWTSMHSVQV